MTTIALSLPNENVMFELFRKVLSSFGYLALQGSTPFLLSQNLSLTSKVVIWCQSQLSRLSSVSLLTLMLIDYPQVNENKNKKQSRCPKI